MGKTCAFPGLKNETGGTRLFLAVVLLFLIPKPMSNLLHPIASYFVLIPLTLIVATIVFGLIRLYGIGMK